MCSRSENISKLKDSHRYKKVWIINGLYFGYPTCCISEFIEGKCFTEDQYKVSNGSGFIPCKRHTKMIIEGVLNIEELITSRYCKQKFENGRLAKKSNP